MAVGSVAIIHLPDEKEPLGNLKINPGDKNCFSCLTPMSEAYFRIFLFRLPMVLKEN